MQCVHSIHILCCAMCKTSVGYQIAMENVMKTLFIYLIFISGPLFSHICAFYSHFSVLSGVSQTAARACCLGASSCVADPRSLASWG